MADIQEMRKYLDSIRTGIEDINSIALEAEEASDGLLKKVADLSGIGTKGGIVRSIVTRGLVAFPMGYRIAQQASSALLVFRYLDKSRQERMKEEKEFNNLMAGREKIVKRLHRMDRDQLKIRNGTLSALEKENYFNDLSVKMKLKTMNIQDAILESSNRLAETTKKIRRTGMKAMGKQAMRRVRGGGTGLNSLRFGATGGSFLQMSEMELQSLGERKGGLDTELGTTEGLLGVAEREYTDAATGSAAKENAKIRMSVLRDTKNALNLAIEDLTEEIAVKSSEMASNIMEIQESTGLSSDATAYGAVHGEEKLAENIEKQALNGDSMLENLEQLTFFGGIFHKMQVYRNKVMKKLSLSLAFFTLKKFKMLGSFLLKGLLVFGGIILVMGMLVALIYAAYQLGVFKYMAKAGGVIMDGVKTFTEGFMQFFLGIYEFISGIWSFFSGFIGFFMGLFSGDGDMMSKSIEKMIDGIKLIGMGLTNILIGALGLIVGAAIVILGGIISSGIMLIGGILSSVFGDNVGDAIGGAGVGAVAGGLIGAYFGGSLGMKVGASIGGLAGGMIGGRMETGGVTGNSGTFLVGERGPELVSLPGNTRVFNNSDTSRMMSPTININVTGRVGASDTELNDIARKIGQKINTQMNRYNSSGLRG